MPVCNESPKDFTAPGTDCKQLLRFQTAPVTACNELLDRLTTCKTKLKKQHPHHWHLAPLRSKTSWALMSWLVHMVLGWALRLRLILALVRRRRATNSAQGNKHEGPPSANASCTIFQTPSMALRSGLLSGSHLTGEGRLRRWPADCPQPMMRRSSLKMTLFGEPPLTEVNFTIPPPLPRHNVEHAFRRPAQIK